MLKLLTILLIGYVWLGYNTSYASSFDFNRDMVSALYLSSEEPIEVDSSSHAQPRLNKLVNQQNANSYLSSLDIEHIARRSYEKTFQSKTNEITITKVEYHSNENFNSYLLYYLGDNATESTVMVCTVKP